jgi:hypothetical protein
MQQSFQDNMGALSSQFETLSILLMRGSNNSKMNSANSRPFLAASALTITTCICVLCQVPSETPPLWQLMPKGERDEDGDIKVWGSSCGHLDFACACLLCLLFLCVMNFLYCL